MNCYKCATPVPDNARFCSTCGTDVTGALTRDRLERLAEVVRRVGDAVPPEALPDFLLTPQPLLRGYRPVELLDSKYSYDDLLAFVESAKSGDMA